MACCCPAIANPPANDVMYAHFLDVGQADATLLEFSCGVILIDAGAQDDDYVVTLETHLKYFFSGRPDLNNTLNAIFITHNHIDHTRGLKEIAKRFVVKNYIGTGQNKHTGTGDPNWIRKHAATRSIKVQIPTNDEVRLSDAVAGLTSSIIDPLDCVGGNPEIVLLSAPLIENPFDTHEEFDNKNNHSLAINVKFGESSFIFTGDLEEDAIDHLVDYYGEEEGGPLDIDVYQVGHHGSHNGTTVPLIDAMTPEIAIFSVGKWDFGKDGGEIFSTYRYGHPRISVLDDLNLSIKKRRSSPKEIMAAIGSRNFKPYKIKKKIYGTGWDGTIKVRANLAGKFRVTTNH